MKKFIIGLLVLVLSVSGIWYFVSSKNSATSSLPPQPVRIGILLTPDGAPAYIAAEKKFYESEGLIPSYTNFGTGKKGLEALINNEVDVALAAQAPIAFESFLNRDFVVISNVSFSAKETQLIARVDKGISSLKDLRGKKIAVIKNTSAQYFLHQLLSEVGLSANDITEESIDLADPSAALKSGKVDAVALYEPYASFVREGMTQSKLWIETGDKETETIVSYIMRKSYLDSHPEVAKRLLLATQKSIDWIGRNRQESIQVSSKLMNLPLPIMESIWGGYDFHLGLGNEYLVSLDSQARWTAVTILQDKKTTPIDYHDFIDPKPLFSTYPSLVTYSH